MKSGKVIWYYQTYDENGRRTNALSTGQTTKSAAKAMCRKLEKEDKLIPTRGSRMLFRDYAKDWWDWDKCEFLQFKRSRKSISRSYADAGMTIMKKHILPYFGSTRLEDITPHSVELWLQKMVDNGLSRSSANHSMAFLGIMLTDAIRREMLKEDVTKKVIPLKSSARRRGILDQATVQALFKESNREVLWLNPRCYYANLLAACTGMRMGEIRGLQYSDLGEGIVSVSKQFLMRHGLSPTKTKESREIPIPFELIEALRSLPHSDPDDFVFASPREHGNPMHPTSIWKALRAALNGLGMDTAEIKEKNITFHSWRHYFNTVMRTNNIADSKLQQMTGHKSSKMTDHYTHYGVQDLEEISRVQAKILPFAKIS